MFVEWILNKEIIAHLLHIVGLRPPRISAVVGEPFQANCSLRDAHHSINSSMLQFCVMHLDNTIVAIDDYVHIVNSASAQLNYTLHTPSQNVLRAHIICFLRNFSNVDCNGIRSRKLSQKHSRVTVGCKYM